MTKYLIAGLGNIGAEYQLTRHNIGFLILDRLADTEKLTFSPVRLAEHAGWKYRGRQVHLIRPTTYMNLSGKAIAYWLQELGIQKENLLVLVDDVALPFGALRLRPRGSAAGHNGLANIEAVLGGPEYARLRFGIGNAYPKGGQVDYVLGNFTGEECARLPARIDRAIDAVKSFVAVGVEQTMNQFN
jgi:PTH1 family peptidyl-tRNA hydrolase